MKIKYFSDTDTLLVEFSDSAVTDSRDLNETTLVEFDRAGKLVSMTIEHAKDQANLNEFVFLPEAKPKYTLSHVAEESEPYSTKKDPQ
ncbi:MAG: DUF2283 domain-containing protein [Kiritimatiellales bacterium]|jgi:uncharacterized protein YuzE